ncbi:Uncharacterized protein Adt_38070 [Abeliophyllum distichum]|uniref:Uncharacterized protein n=1 Tax=Abeliophyllum distichum TaxID=126358 RepID=A0ABD1Q241_9LAMI
MDHSYIIKDALLEVEDVGPQEDANDEEEAEIPGLQLSDSNDEVNDGDFEFYKNAPKRIHVGYNIDPTIEEANEGIGELGLDIDKDYYPSSEELNTDYSSAEDNYRFPTFDPGKKNFDPQLEVGKRDM